MAEHAKDLNSSPKKEAVALVRLREECDLDLDADMLARSLAKTYPWRWDWKAKKVSDTAFLVNFPSAAKIDEAAIYDWVPLRGGNIMVNVKLWNDDSMAVGKLTVVWVKAKGEPKTMKNSHGLYEIGSMIGFTQEVDMQTLQETGLVRLKVAVVNHLKILRWTKLTTPKLMIYRIFFELEEIVEEGWSKSDDELSQGYEDWMDFQQEEEDVRDPKRARTSDEEMVSGQICATTRTKIALEERAAALKEQDEADLLLYKNKDKAVANERREELEDSVSVNGGGAAEELINDKELPSDANPDDGVEGSQSLSLGAKLGIKLNEGQTSMTSVEGDNSRNGDVGSQRYSGRIASKNVDDIPMLDRAMSLARAKNLPNLEGIPSDRSDFSSENVKLLDVASLIGVDLGVSLDMVEHNLKLIQSHESARREMYLASKREASSNHVEEEILHPEDVDSILLELQQMSKEIDAECDPLMENSCGIAEMMRGGFRANSAHYEAVAVKTPVRTVLRRSKKRILSVCFFSISQQNVERPGLELWGHWGF